MSNEEILNRYTALMNRKQNVFRDAIVHVPLSMLRGDLWGLLPDEDVQRFLESVQDIPDETIVNISPDGRFSLAADEIGQLLQFDTD